MNLLRMSINKWHYHIAFGIVIAALILKCCYLFPIISFHNSLHRDMAEYWYDSIQLAWGNHIYLSQWGGFAPFYKYYFLVPFFKFLNSLGYLSYSVPLIILVNILLYSVSSYVFYLVVNRLIADKITALIALIFYAFSYLATYVNALILPDSLAISITVVSTGIVILTPRRIAVFIAGLFLGVAIAAKPFLFVFSPIFMWYIYSKKMNKNSVWKVVIFTVALVVVPLMTMAENNRVSHGKLKGLAAIGGSNFFQGWGKVRALRSLSVEGEDSRISPGTLDEPAWKSVTVKEPWYHQGYFYRLGFEAISKNPCVLFEKIFWFKKLFWGILGPKLEKFPVGYNQIMPVVQNISYIMFLSLGIFWLFVRRFTDTKTVFFLILLLTSFFIAIYAFGLPERRYFLNIEFLVTALFFVIINRAIVLYRIYRKEIWMYAFFVFSFFFCVPMTWAHLSKLF